MATFTKKPWASKVFWVNLVIVAVAIVDLVTALNLPIVNTPWFGVITAGVNLILRPFTRKKIVLRGS